MGGHIHYTTANSSSDLQGILELQKQNLTSAITEEEMASQGFVTVKHSYIELEKLNHLEKHMIGKDGDRVIAYLLAMTEQSKADIPVLRPMFDIFHQVYYRNKKVADYSYVVVGQACVDKAYRGRGILDHCYAFYKEHFSKRFEFAITEIATSNTRSLAAHRRIGFEELHRYTAPDGKTWAIVLWDWNSRTLE